MKALFGTLAFKGAMMPSPDPRGSLLGSLTEGQKAALDLLIEFKTSKEIARELGISHHTVEQRLRFARQKLGVTARSDLAATYRHLKEVCDPVAYDDLSLPLPADQPHPPEQDEAIGLRSAKHPPRIKSLAEESEPGGTRIVPEMFEGRYGTWVRIAAIFGFTLLLAILVLSGLAIFGQLSDLLAS